MDQLKKGTGKMGYYMVKEVNSRKVMGRATKEHIKKENFMELDYVSLLIKIFMKDNGVRGKGMDMEKIIRLTEANMLEIGKMI